METLSHDAYLSLHDGATLIESDGHGEKVLRLRDGSYLKLFRRKRLLSSAAWYPYAQRFADNARILAQRGIPCPYIINVFRIPSVARDAAQYRPLAGQTLRELVKRGSASGRLRELLFIFINRLHERGIYFRSLHLGNIVLTSDNLLGLIDIADMKIQDRPLTAYKRQRNLKHLYRDPADQAWLRAGSELGT